MQKDNTSQLEMFNFNEQSAAYGKGAGGRDSARFDKVRGFQKFILSTVIVLLISIFSFSLGVEKGKKAGLNLARIAAAIPAKIAPVAPVLAVPPENVPQAEVKQPLAVTVNKQSASPSVSGKPANGSNFTIQVASISSSDNAKKELARLKNNGYSAFSLAKGKYIIICVGKFGEKQEAQYSAQKLKSKYPDCMIRRL